MRKVAAAYSSSSTRKKAPQDFAEKKKMGKKSKSSRKGKKEWRANISAEDIDDFFEKSTKDALSGGSLADVPSDSLFYVDKSRDLSVKRKIEKHREKVLHADSVLAKNPFVQTIPTSRQRESKKKKKSIKLPTIAEQDPSKDDEGMRDLWNGETVKSKKKHKRCIIPAVEIDSAGCSFNPDSESHQDSLASAVADEMEKVYRAELGPAPIPLITPGEALDEEDMLFLEADAGSDADGEDEAIPQDSEVNVDQRVGKAKRMTRVEWNRRARRKERLKAEEASKKVQKLASEIDSLPNILEEIKKEDEEKERKHLRREIAKKERLKVRPPRIGRQKFQAAPVQVLLSEEITGSLRQLKGCPTLARDRFKSLEKRGLVIPSKKSGRK